MNINRIKIISITRVELASYKRKTTFSCPLIMWKVTYKTEVLLDSWKFPQIWIVSDSEELKFQQLN